jgi:excinuclease ABC subunit A
VNGCLTSVETAFLEEMVNVLSVSGVKTELNHSIFSNRFEADGISFEEPTEMLFNLQ